jgi:hypothetical protein
MSVLGSLVGCTLDVDDHSIELSDDAVIEYHYSDSWESPSDHLSYSVTIREDLVRVVVDKHGERLHSTTSQPLPDEVWDDLKTGVNDLVPILDHDVRQDEDRCEDDPSRSISIISSGDVVFDLTMPLCFNDAAVEALDAYLQPAIGTVPDWETIVD